MRVLLEVEVRITNNKPNEKTSFVLVPVVGVGVEFVGEVVPGLGRGVLGFDAAVDLEDVLGLAIFDLVGLQIVFGGLQREDFVELLRILDLSGHPNESVAFCFHFY